MKNTTRVCVNFVGYSVCLTWSISVAMLLSEALTSLGMIVLNFARVLRVSGIVMPYPVTGFHFRLMLFIVSMISFMLQTLIFFLAQLRDCNVVCNMKRPFRRKYIIHAQSRDKLYGNTLSERNLLSTSLSKSVKNDVTLIQIHLY